MALFEWTPEFSVSVARFDAEHQKLFSLINQLAESIQEGRGSELAFPVLQELAEYTRNHFEAEENAMRQASFPGLDDHLAEHRTLVGKLTDFFADYDANSERIEMDLLLFLRCWLENHILVRDKQYGPALNSAGIN